MGIHPVPEAGDEQSPEGGVVGVGSGQRAHPSRVPLDVVLIWVPPVLGEDRSDRSGSFRGSLRRGGEGSILGRPRAVDVRPGRFDDPSRPQQVDQDLFGEALFHGA